MAAIQGYFSHDSNARNDEKMIRVRMKHGVAGYGVFFMLLERLKEEADYTCAADYAALAFDFRADEVLIKSVVEDFGLFSLTDDGTRFFSQGFKDRMAIKDDISKVRSEAGKRGIAKRWEQKQIANVTENDSKVIANAIEENSKVIANATENDSNKSKEKKSKEKEIITNKKEPPTPLKGDGVEGGFFKFMISLDNRSKLMKVFGTEVSPEYQNEALRLCSWTNEEGRERCAHAVNMFLAWEEKKNEPFYYVVQRVQDSEQKGEIFPPKKDLWRVWCFIEALHKYDRTKIYELIKSEDDIELVKECIKTIKNPAKKIQAPGRYIIQSLKNNQ